MKIGIAGYGMVGVAHHALLKKTHDVVINDPEKRYYDSFETVDCIIICVSTPARSDGSCEMKNVYEVIESAPDVPILIKSTISVEGWDMLVDAFPNRMINFSPEFLRAQTAIEDLQNTKLMLIGGTANSFWANVFNIDVEIADPRELVLAKYARNTFLALKVSFFNQIYDLCKSLNIEYDAVARYTGMDSRITESHTQITEERGFGGHCFPKDIAALIKTGQRNNVDLSILQEALDYNNRIRKN